MRNYTEHSFYCIKCGKKGIPCMRKDSAKHSRFHRKKLFCIYCQTEINHIECNDQYDVEEFLENFSKGVYADEAEASISFVRSGGCR